MNTLPPPVNPTPEKRGFIDKVKAAPLWQKIVGVVVVLLVVIGIVGSGGKAEEKTTEDTVAVETTEVAAETTEAVVETTEPVPAATSAPATTVVHTTIPPVTTTTVPPPSTRDLILISISSGSMTEAFRSDLWMLDRIDLLTSDVVNGSLTLSTTSGYSTYEYQIETAQETVYFLATTLWVDDIFGDGEPVAFAYSQDGMSWLLTSEQMYQISRSQLPVSSLIN